MKNPPMSNEQIKLGQTINLIGLYYELNCTQFSKDSIVFFQLEDAYKYICFS